MSNSSRHSVLETVGACVIGLIKQLTPDPEEQCVAAFEKLGPLVRMAKTMTADDVTPHFTAGIQEVIAHLDAFRTGFARTAEQEDGDTLVKASCFKPRTSDMTVPEFLQHADSTLRKAVKCAEGGEVGKALSALHTLVRDIHKAESFEDTVAEKITVTVDNDPMRIVETEAPGTLAPTGTSAPQSAASNYVTNPGDVSTAAPSTAPNAATASVEAVRTAEPVGDSNFIAKAAEAVIAKSLDAIRSTVSKASGDARVSAVGWVSDLNSVEFLHGGRPREKF
jgi:hypothetical protein